MKRLYAPWRTAYAQKVDKGVPTCSEPCVFCSQLAAHSDDQFFILKRYDHCAIMLNAYPYNAGHLLVIPYVHVATLGLLAKEVRSELMEVISGGIDVLTQTLIPQGFNIGANMGIVAGGSIPSHIHLHILPRWQNDTGFLPTLADTKQISVDLHKVFVQLKQKFST